MLEVNKIKSENDIVEVIGRFVSLKKQGAQHVGHCPFHKDDKESLQVSQSKQVFKCFACGNASGDMNDFVMKYRGVSLPEALEIIDNGRTSDASIKTKTAPKWTPEIPLSEPAEINHFKFGIPSKSWKYTDENGQLLSFVCRFDLEDGSKQVLPYTYATNGNMSEWRWLGLDTPRPLYNLKMLNDYPLATILLVEGEKTADACQSQINPSEVVVTCWIGGANGIKNSDFSPINGRRTILWPDNDTEQKDSQGNIKPWQEQPGNACMLEILKVSKPSITKWVLNPEGLPHKWDAADKEWDLQNNEMKNFIRDNSVSVDQLPISDAPVTTEPTPTPVITESPKNPPLPPAMPSNKITNENDHFRFLGFSKEEGKLVYCFFSFDAKSVVKLTPPSMSKPNLQQMAPLSFWERMFPGNKSKIDIDSAQQYLINSAHDIGIFQEKFIRGRGAWMDNGNLIIHAGVNLIIAGKKVPLRDFRSDFVYEAGAPLGIGYKTPLKTSESSKLIDKLDWLKWEREINAYLLAGWCVIAPFCGVLNWRPHIWLTGPTGSGKSWTMENIVKKLMGETAIVVQGKTTEAGVRGLLQSDARPVLFDETDVDSHNDKERIQSVLSLARSSSYSDGGATVKGTVSGGSRSVMIRSCFALSSIGVQLNQQSDRSRFTVLGMNAFEKKQSKEEFLKFENGFLELVTDDYVSSLQARTMEILPVIIKNSKTFSDAAAHVIGNRRLGDQVGSLLAGAYSLKSKSEISYDDAISWISQRDWSEETALEQTKDEFLLLALIMGKIIRVETTDRQVDRTIGELVMIASGDRHENGLFQEDADNRLRRMGIMVNGRQMLIANNSSQISILLRDSSWSSNYNKILERLPDTVKIDARNFAPGLKSRCIGIPIELLGDAVVKVDEVEDELPF